MQQIERYFIFKFNFWGSNQIKKGFSELSEIWSRLIRTIVSETVLSISFLINTALETIKLLRNLFTEQTEATESYNFDRLYFSDNFLPFVRYRDEDKTNQFQKKNIGTENYISVYVTDAENDLLIIFINKKTCECYFDHYSVQFTTFNLEWSVCFMLQLFRYFCILLIRMRFFSLVYSVFYSYK